MPTFKYKISTTINRISSNFKAERVEAELNKGASLQSHISSYFAKKFSNVSTSINSNNSVADYSKLNLSKITVKNDDKILTIKVNCTEKNCDETLVECLSDLYLRTNPICDYSDYYLVSLQKSSLGSLEYFIYSTISVSYSDYSGKEEQEKRSDNKRLFFEELLGIELEEVKELNFVENDDYMIVNAYCGKSKREEIISNSLVKVNVILDKIYCGEICFYPDYMRGMDNRIAVMERAAALFESKSVEDPLDRSKSHRNWQATNVKPLGAFNIVVSEFLEHAQKMKPERPIATVSDFSQWVYSLYSNKFGDETDKEIGKSIEPAILEQRKKATCSIDNDFLSRIRSDWKLIHNGLHLNEHQPKNHFEINSLQINGYPLRASPDLIFHNKLTSEVIIVEIKYSRLPITTNLWPNVWAQLWCYSQLEIPRKASKLSVVGEVWGERWEQRVRRKREGDPLLFLRASVHRDPRAPAYDRFFKKLFEIYSAKN